ncbi:MAG TPA: sigma-54 dependent transcriptional regulator [Anaerolineaceae bacterium]
MSFKVLIVDDEEHFRSTASEMLTKAGFEAISAGTLADARQLLARGEGDVVILDVNLPDGYGPSLLNEMAGNPYRPPIILITAYGDIEMAVEAMKNGAHDFIPKPIKFPQLEKSIRRACEFVSMRRELEHYRETQSRQSDYVIGNNAGMQAVIRQAQRAGEMSVSVLITGETGTGKEVLAALIHNASPRRNKPLIAFNCAAIQPTMLESELFGHESGAFTGADRRKPGLMELADGGVLFMDEIASMPLDMQAKLLRVLEERAFRRVGGTNLIKIDILLVAASNRDLKSMMKSGGFREDLYYRLKVVDLHLPPLRDRKEDIPELVGYFVRKFNAQMGMNVVSVSPKVLQIFSEYNWPGNLRELRNVIERAMLFCNGEVIEPQDLSMDITAHV